MDKITKQILRRVRDKQSIRYSVVENPFSDIAPEILANASLEYLAKHDYIHIVDGLTNEIVLSYRSFHPIRHYLKMFFSYLVNNWIAVVALVISLCSLLVQISK